MYNILEYREQILCKNTIRKQLYCSSMHRHIKPYRNGGMTYKKIIQLVENCTNMIKNNKIKNNKIKNNSYTGNLVESIKSIRP